MAMSQHDGPFPPQTQHQLDIYPHSQESPTIGRTQNYHPANNSSPLPSETTRKRSQRKAVPSPLQTSTTPTSSSTSITPTRTTFYSGAVDDHTPTSPNTNRYTQEKPLSPKERLDDLLASEKTFYKPASKDSPPRYFPQEKLRYGRPLQDTNGTSRSVSDPVLTPGSSSTSTRPAMAATAPQHRMEMGLPPPRTSSIDSAISNISGVGQSSKPPQDRSTTPDIGNLIQAAGSPEAVIQYLLKEKQSQATQNAQLWRLVDKQRAMILGLNKDLERALKDKERYRKKLKESLAQLSNPSPVDSTQGMPSDTGSATSEKGRIVELPAKDPNVEALVSAGLREGVNDSDELQHSPIDIALAPYPITPPAYQPNHDANQALSNMVEAEHKMPSPTKHAFQQYDPDAPPAGFEAGQQLRKAAEVSRELPYNANVPPSRSLPSGPPPRASLPKAPTLITPSVSVIEPSPDVDRGSPKFPPLRRAPPAPLNLRKQNEPSSHLRQVSGTGEESDSDYDDILEVDEIPAFTERGRRKTREEDDREREIAAQRDAEIRSLSKKSKSRPTTPSGKAEVVPPPPESAMPLSPRQTKHIAPPGEPQRTMSSENAGSLAGMLSASVHLEASTKPMSAGTMSPPLLSPGLPSSPRPMSPGLPLSPRPMGGFASPRGSQGSNQSLNSPPMSPRGMGAFSGPTPLSPRAPRQPIPLPPNTPMSMTSPGMPRPDALNLSSPKPVILRKTEPETKAGEDSPGHESFTHRNVIYKGFVTEEYPELLLPPNALPSIYVKVASSRLKPSRASLMFPMNLENDPVFTLAVFSRSDDTELWRCEKDSASLATLDQLLRQNTAFTARLPEKSLFSGHAPAKVDARRAALDQYLDELLNTPMDTESGIEICKYLSTNAMEPNAEDGAPPSVDTAEKVTVKTGPGGRPLKNGYLTKRGKNFGGWKARFFVLDGPVFKYYESPGGPHLGAIKLQNAQIGKQQQQSDNQSPSRGDVDDVDNQYRHAFLILEPKRKDSSSLVRHVLCAESDKERDEWVEALLRYVDYKDPDDENYRDQKPPSRQEHTRNDSGGSGQTNSTLTKKKMYAQGKSHTLPNLNDNLQGVSYETTKQGSVPRGVRTKNSGTPSPPTSGYDRDQGQLPQSQSTKSISGPKNAQVIQDVGSWGNRQNLLAPISTEDKIKQKKRSFFGFGPKPRVSMDSQDTPNNDSSTNLSQLAYEQHGPIRPVFGAPLSEAVKYNHPVDVSIELPAVVYRCIEYLDAKNAAGEEGIFRLSGSNVVIRALRERFNIEGDVNLVTDEQYYDIHAVASLLKLYLRELPSTILTRELHLDFLAVTDLHDVNEKISALNGLVHRLPKANNTLLRYLSGFLINIINHADTNKMTVRNVGIVFSPTLNIPAPVFALFLQQYDGIFGAEPDEHDQHFEVSVTAPLTPEDIRSPRRSKFAQDLPTPSYHTPHSFQQAQHSGFPPPQHYQPTRAGYDTGFTPLQPSYEQGFNTMAGPEYGSRAPTLAGPAYDQFNRPYGNENSAPQSKSKRRESSMFGMGMGITPRKQSRKEDSNLVEGESFFD